MVVFKMTQYRYSSLLRTTFEEPVNMQFINMRQHVQVYGDILAITTLLLSLSWNSVVKLSKDLKNDTSVLFCWGVS